MSDPDPSSSDPNPRSREPQRIPLQKCAACGAWCVLEVPRCLECGAPLREEEPAPPPPPERGRGEETGRGEPGPASGGGRAARGSRRPPYVTMLVSLAMFGVLSSMAIPVLRSVLADGRMTLQANTLVGSLRLARSVAIKSRSTVRICPAATSSAGSATCASGPGAWEHGWIVYADRNRNGRLDGSPGECRATTAIGDCIVAVEPALEGKNRLRGTSEVAAGLAFLPNGRSEQTGTFSLCDPARATAPRTVAVRGTGRVETLAPRGSAGACD